MCVCPPPPSLPPFISRERDHQRWSFDIEISAHLRAVDLHSAAMYSQTSRARALRRSLWYIMPLNHLFPQLLKPPVLTKNLFGGRDIENPKTPCHFPHLPRRTSWASLIITRLPLCSSTLPHVSRPFQTEPTSFNQRDPESTPFASHKNTSER